MKLSVVILTHNEAGHLAELLPQLSFSDEVIVIDDNSTDETRKILKRFGIKSYKRSLNNDWASQRNFGLGKAKGEWVLFIDADERVSKELQKEIKQKIRLKKVDGFWIRRVDEFFKREMKYGEMGRMWLMRLGRRNSGIWHRPVHEVWSIKNSRKLIHVILHKSHHSLKEFVESVKRYAAIEADFRIDKKLDWSILDLLVYPVGKFLKGFIYQLGFLDGWRGFLASVMMSYHSFLVRWNLIKKSMSRRSNGLNVLFWAFLCSVPLGQIGRIQVSDNAAIYVWEILMGIITIYGFIYLFKRKLVSIFDNLDKSLIIFNLILGLSLLINFRNYETSQLLTALLYLLRFVFYSFYYWFVKNFIKCGLLKINFKRTVFWWGLIFALGAIVQYLLLPDTRFLYYFGFDDHFYRAIGTVLDPGFLGLLLVLGLVSYPAGAVGVERLLYPFLIAVLGLTYARSAYLVFLIIAILAVLFKWHRRFFLVQICLLALVILLLPRPGGDGVKLERVYSITSRIDSGNRAWDVFMKYPALGVGFNAYKFNKEKNINILNTVDHASAPDSSFLLVLATSGIVGMAAFLWFLLNIWKKIYKRKWMWLSLIAILTHSMTNNSFFYPLIMLWLLMILWQREEELRESKLL